jgi:type II secretion system protein H
MIWRAQQLNDRDKARIPRPAPFFCVSRFAFYVSRSPAFTLIELILVMAILTMMVSLTAPTLSHFFRGRTLDSEARRLLALTRQGQARAVSEGIPIDLWVNAPQGQFGLQAEPSYETQDARAIDFTIDSSLQLEVVSQTVVPVSTQSRNLSSATTDGSSVLKITLARAGLPTIRFLPDGSISETSPQKLHLTGREGAALWVALARDRLSYEIRNSDK